MLGFLALAGLLMGGFAFMAVCGLIFLVLRVVFWAVFFPIRILMKLLWLPFALIGGVLSLAAGVTILPILLTIGLVVAAVAALAALVALLVPATPFVLLGLMIWVVMRRRPVPAS